MQRLILVLDALFILAIVWVVANLVHFIATTGKTTAKSRFFVLSNILRKSKGEPK